MKEENSHIENMKRENIHRVPEGYFEDLPMKIQSRIAEEPKTVSFIPRMQLALYATAAVILISLSLVFFYKTEKPVDYLAQVSTEDIVDYLQEENISSYEIASVIDVSELLEDESYLEELEDFSEEDLESIYSEYDYSIDVL